MLPPNLHEYVKEVRSAIWKFLKSEVQDECVVHGRHMFLFARKARARTSSLGFLDKTPPFTKFRDRGLFRSSNFSHVTANRFCQDLFFIDIYLFVHSSMVCEQLH